MSVFKNKFKNSAQISDFINTRFGFMKLVFEFVIGQKKIPTNFTTGEDLEHMKKTHINFLCYLGKGCGLLVYHKFFLGNCSNVFKFEEIHTS